MGPKHSVSIKSHTKCLPCYFHQEWTKATIPWQRNVLTDLLGISSPPNSSLKGKYSSKMQLKVFTCCQGDHSKLCMFGCFVQGLLQRAVWGPCRTEAGDSQWPLPRTCHQHKEAAVLLGAPALSGDSQHLLTAWWRGIELSLAVTGTALRVLPASQLPVRPDEVSITSAHSCILPLPWVFPWLPPH